MPPQLLKASVKTTEKGDRFCCVMLLEVTIEADKLLRSSCILELALFTQQAHLVPSATLAQ